VKPWNDNDALKVQWVTLPSDCQNPAVSPATWLAYWQAQLLLIAAASLRLSQYQLISLRQVDRLQKDSVATLPELQLKTQLEVLLRKVRGMEVGVQLETQLEVLLGTGLGMLVGALVGVQLCLVPGMLLGMPQKTLLGMLVVLPMLRMGSPLCRIGLMDMEEGGRELRRAITLSCWWFAVLLLLLLLHAMHLLHLMLETCLQPSLLASWILSQSLLGVQSQLWYRLSPVQHFVKQIQHPLSQL